MDEETMTGQRHLYGVTFTSNEEGIIQTVIHDSLGMFENEPPESQSFIKFLEEDSTEKGAQILQIVLEDGAAYNRELYRRGDESSELLLLSGIRTDIDKNLFWVGTTGPGHARKYIDGLMEINNEHVNDLRLVLKEKEQTEAGNLLLDEMSSLNNELSNIQRQLVKKTKELEHSNDLKNRMLGMAAHDLRSPLSVILNFANFLIEDHRSESIFTDHQFEMIREIKNSSTYMVQIIEDLLDISTIESGSINLSREESDLTELVRHTVTLNRNPANKKNIQLLDDLPEKPVKRNVDSRKLEQVMNNLISNAIKYSHPGTSTTVGIELPKENEEPVVIFVKDEGQGIPDKEMDSLFKPFSTISVKPTGGEKSTGLGLAISKKIVEAHNGRIYVKNNRSKGATFFVEIP